MAFRFRLARDASESRASVREETNEGELRPLTSTGRRDESALSSVEQAALIAGRVIFGGYFLYSGIHHFTDREMLVGYAKSKGVAFPEAAVLGSGAMLVLGGLSLLSGVRPKVGASLVTAFLAGVTPQIHDFWNVEEPNRRMSEMVNFTKNLALAGGAAFAATV